MEKNELSKYLPKGITVTFQNFLRIFKDSENSLEFSDGNETSWSSIMFLGSRQFIFLTRE